MIRRISIPALLLLATLAGCAAVWPDGSPVFPGHATTQPSKTPARRLYESNELVAGLANGMKGAVTAGLLTQAQADKYQPFFVAYYSASVEAAREIKQAAADRAAGKPVTDTAAEDAVRQVNAALEPLRPLILKLGVKTP